MDIFLADEQAIPVDHDELVLLARHVLEWEGQPPETEVSVLLIDDNEMSNLRERFLGESGPTDVLAFPLEEDEDEGPEWPPGHTVEAEQPYLLGDVVICPSIAASQADETGHGLEEELSLLLIHGLLHLIGYDHADEDDAARMEERQAYYLRGRDEGSDEGRDA
jgi:probable rRNA maturation factor